MSMRSAAVVAGLALGLMSGTAEAALITYEFTGIASGTYGSRSFDNESFRIDLMADTNSVYVPARDVLSNVGSTKVSVTGVFFNYSISLNTDAFLNQSTGNIGLGSLSQGGETDLFYGFSALASRYDFASDFPIMPLSGIYNGLSDGVQVNGETLAVTNIASLNFSATVSAVPLPSSAPMFGAALLGLAGLGYAAKRKKAAAAA